MSVSFSYELKSIRAKLARLLDVFASLSHAPVPISEWPYWMEKFNALASQYQSLQKELTLALESAVVEPCVAQGEHIPGVLLRSKMPPEVEASCKEAMGEQVTPEDWRQTQSTLSALLESFSALREVFELGLKTKSVKETKAPQSPRGLESAIAFMYQGNINSV